MSKKVKISTCMKPFQSSGSNQENLSRVKESIEKLLSLKEPLDYQVNYRSIYSLIHNKAGEQLYVLVTEAIESFILNKKQLSVSSTNLPEQICVLWEDFKTSLKAIVGLLIYTENTYFRENMKPGFYTYGISLFKSNIFVQGQIAENIKDWLINESLKNKSELVYEKNILKSIIGMLVEIGLGTIQVYSEVFECKYIEESYKYYKQEAEKKIVELGVSDYLNLVSFRLKQEIEMCQTVLHNSTQNLIIDAIYKAFIESHLDEIFSQDTLLDIIKKKDYETLSRFYELLCEKGSYLNRLKEEFKKDLKKIVSKMISDDNSKKKPLDVIEEILSFLDVFNYIKNKCFHRNQVLETESNLAFELALNKNNSISIYLAVYLNVFIKSKVKSLSDGEAEAMIVKLLTILQFVTDKDLFEFKHREMMALRLLNKSIANIEIEKNIVKFIKQESGLKFVNRLQGMINDIENNILIDSEEISVQILTSNFWPKEKFLHIITPESFSQLCKESLNKYCSTHTGRTLIYRLEYGTCVVNMLANKNYTLIGTIFQGCILLLFNTKSSYLLDELLATIGGSPKEIKKNILGLVKSKILLKNSKGKVLLDTDNLWVNEKFSSNLNRIHLEVVNFEDTEKEKVVADKEVDDSRKHFIEATVVKIMKMRNVIEHKLLVAEVIKFCVGRFSPDIKMIKDRIEGLILREYISRSKDQYDVYHYIA